MKILLELANRNAEVYLSLCMALKRKYPDLEFACFSRDMSTTKIFEDSKDLRFSIYDPYTKKNQTYSHHDEDIELIRKYEDFSGLTIWKMIAADRLIGWNDHIGNYPTYINKNLRSDREYVIAKVANEIRRN